MREDLRKKVLSLGADICRFAAIGRFSDAPKGYHPRDLYPACQSVVAFGIALPKGLYSVDSRIIYSHFNQFACPQVDLIAYQTARFIETAFQGIGVPIPCDAPYDFWDEEKKEGRGLLSMKHVAYLAGIGSLGKNTLLLNKDYGNRLIIGCVLTDLSLASDDMAADVCREACDLCVRSCPTGAIKVHHVEQKPCRANSFGKTGRGFETVECNRCRIVCPMRFGSQP